MKIEYEGETLDFDMEQLTVRQAMYLKSKLGLTLLGLDQGLMAGDPDALLAIFWLIRTHADGCKPVEIDTLDFKVVKLAEAVQNAVEAEQAAQEAAAEADPKEGPADEQPLIVIPSVCTGVTLLNFAASTWATWRTTATARRRALMD